MNKSDLLATDHGPLQPLAIVHVQLTGRPASPRPMQVVPLLNPVYLLTYCLLLDIIFAVIVVKD
jgi:hypothetical protein